MNIVASYAGKLIHSCDWCKGSVNMGERIIRGSWWWKKWRYTKYWHRRCYIEQLDAYWDSNPFIAKERGGHSTGRPKLNLDVDQRRKRKTLLVMAHRLRNEMRDVIDLGMPNWISRRQEVIEKLEVVRAKLEEVGGIPTNWR